MMVIIEWIFDVLFNWGLGVLIDELLYWCRFVFYPFFAVGLYRIAVRENMAHPFMAIIPYYNMRYISKIINTVYIFGKRVSGVVLTILLVICTVLRCPFAGEIPVVGNVLETISPIFLFVYILALHKLWEIYIPKSADSYTILAAIFPVLIPILIFRIRNRQQASSKMLIDYDSDGAIDEVISLHGAEKQNNSNKDSNKKVIKRDEGIYWLENCPVLLENQELLSANDNELILEFTLQNLLEDTIKAVYLDVLCYDYLQNPLQNISNLELIDLDIKPNEKYRTHIKIVLPDNNTRKCKYVIKHIVFESESVWSDENGLALEPVQKPAKIEFKNELVKYMSNHKLKGKAIPANQYKFLPVETEKYWLCGCGQFNNNTNNKCSYCHIDKIEIFETINEEKLQQEYEQMLEEKRQKSLEAKEQRQRIVNEQKEKISNQLSTGKSKLDNMLHKKEK